MKTIKNYLAIFVFLAAALSSFAFNSPKEASTQMLFGQLPDGSWVEANPGQYSCDEAEQTCTAELVNNDPKRGEIVPDTETEGIFVPN